MPYCPSPYSQVYLASLETLTPLTLCTAQEANLNGSAVAQYNGTTYYDALLWAAAWMFKATGDSTYLTDSEDFYVRHVYNVSSLVGAAAGASCSLWLGAGLPGRHTPGGSTGPVLGTEPGSASLPGHRWLPGWALRFLITAAPALPPALLQEGGGSTLTYDWSSYYWAGNVLLAELTDGGTFHQQSQHFMKMWVCGSGGVSRLLWRP